MSYESPITVIQDTANKLNADIENRIYHAVIKIGIDVNKEELVKALHYDRNQYAKGYADGRNDAITHAHWEWHYDIDQDRDYKEPFSSENKSGWRCSHCNGRLEDMVGGKWDEIEEPPELEYCPGCGAKMDEKGEENETE